MTAMADPAPSRPPIPTTLRTLLGLLLAAAVCVGAWLAVEQQAADLDRAANEVLATSSGANDSVTNARLAVVFRQLELLGPVRSGLGAGAFLALVAAVAIGAAVIARARGVRAAPPVPGTSAVLWVLGVVLGLGSVAAAIAYALHLRTLDDGFTVDAGFGPAVMAGFLASGLFVAGTTAVAGALLVPAVRGRGAVARVVVAVVLGLVLAGIAVVSSLLVSTNLLAAWIQASAFRTPAADVGARVVDSVLRTVDDGPAIGAGLMLVAALTAGLLAPRRPRRRRRPGQPA
jgi:hypothetical protein